MKNKVGAITVVENRSESLDLARADPMVAIKSQYHIGRGHGSRNFNIYVQSATSDSDIRGSDAKSHRERNGEGPLYNSDER